MDEPSHYLRANDWTVMSKRMTEREFAKNLNAGSRGSNPF